MGHWTENDCEEEITCFSKNHVAFLFTFFEKVCAICEFRF